MTPALLTDLATALTAGLLGSIHCAGMCGPLAALGCRTQFVSQPAKTSTQKIWPLLFVAGKLLAYSLLGLLAGSFGAALMRRAESNHTVAIASIVTAVLMIIVVILSRTHPQLLGKYLSRAAGNLTKLGLRFGWKAPLFVGAAASLIPCGLLYAMVLRSAVAGDPLYSMFIMQAFGIGTSPVLLGLGSLAAWLPQRWTKQGALAGEFVLILSAGVLLWRGVIGLQADPVAACCGTPTP